MNLKNIKNQFLNLDIYIPNKKELFIIAFLLGFVTYFKLELLQPWNISSFDNGIKSFILLGFGVVEFLVFLIAFTLPIIFCRNGKEGNEDKLWKVITLFIFKIWVMATAIDLSMNFLFPDRVDYNFHLKFMPNHVNHVLEIGFIPFSMLALWFYYKTSMKNVSNLNQEVIDLEPFIIVKSSQKGLDIKIKISDIIYMKSDRNYLEIYYLENGIEKKVLHRSSISAMVDQLPKDIFCRIHNSYLVKLSLISKPYTLNSTYVIRLKSSKETILPVSRTYLKAVRQALVK